MKGLRVRRGRSRLLAGVVAVAVAVGAAACGSGSAGSASGSGTLVVDASFDLKTVDPGRQYELTGQMITKGLYETLLTFEGGDLTEPVGALAESYELSADARTLTLRLAPGRVFSDGSPVTADDVVFSLQRVAGIKGNPSFLLDGVSVARQDDTTVVLTSEEPNPALPSVLPNPALSILNAEVVTANGGTTDERDGAERFLNGVSAGSGPYVLESLDVSSRAVLTRNEAYNGPTPPAYDTVVVRNVEASTQALNVQKGDSQVVLDLSGDQVAGLDTGRVAVTSNPSATVIFLLLNQSAEVSPVTSDPRFVEAVRRAVDYEDLVAVAGSGAVQAPGVIPTAIAGALPEDAGLRRDLAGAAAALGAGAPAGDPPQLAYPSDLTLNGLSFQTLAERLQAQLADAGITVELAPGPVATELDNYRNGREQMGLWYWSPDFPDASNYLAFAPGGLIGLRANWPTGVAPEVDAAAAAAGAAVGAAEREALFQQFQERLNAQGPFIPLLQPPTNIVSATSVVGATYNPIWTIDVAAVRPA